MNKMFCYQCQETANGKGCTTVGVCGKKSDVALLQDLLLYVAKGVAICSIQTGKDDKNVRHFILDALFTTITNVNFDKNVLIEKIKKGLSLRDSMRMSCSGDGSCCSTLHDAAIWKAETEEDFLKKAEEVGVLSEKDEDIRSLKDLLIYGVKGIAAYLYHANILGYDKDDIHEFIKKALSLSLSDKLGIDELFNLVMEAGKFAVDTMALLDEANTKTYGDPEITEVNIGVRNNPAILISGHDLKDLEELLKQTEGTGVDVYTHGEMLPAHYYPYFKKYDHFVGNYGNAWWKQNDEFEKFNGPIVMTTNCLVPPRDSYKDRVYTTGPVDFEGLKRIEEKDGKKDFSDVIEHAKRCNPPEEIENGNIIGGFAHAQVLKLSDKVIENIKNGNIKRFVVMAGCDGRHKTREEYTEFAKKLPGDNIILTAGCAKYRYNKLNLGDINGIPRILDAGQCNDSYSLVLIAMKLKEVLGLDDINDLPIVYNIAWYEQKAVTVLLALLYLGVKNIHLGPTLPAFLSPNVLKVLIEKFNIDGMLKVDDISSI